MSETVEGVVMNLEIIENLKKKVVDEVPNLMKKDLAEIIMFGSCARGDFSDDSDVDIALIAKCDRAEMKKYDECLDEMATEIAMEIYAIVNFICIPETEFNEKKSWYALYKNIDNEGIKLYG